MDKNNNTLRRVFLLTAALLFAVSLLCSRLGDKTRFAVINPGDRCADVYLIQSRLKELGYETADEPGCFSYGTVRALKRFQADNGLTGGSADSATLAALGFDSRIGCFGLKTLLLSAVIQRDMGAATYAEKLLYARNLLKSTGNNFEISLLLVHGENDINLCELSETVPDADSRSAALAALNEEL